MKSRALWVAWVTLKEMSMPLKSALATLAVCVALTATWFTPVAQAASCTAKCAETEQACVKRTNNKGQCAKAANQCTAKCR